MNANLPQRKQECQDIQTCLQRNDKGECVGGFGYCMAEKTVYRFQADECPARFASCRIYSNRRSERVGYLRNTIDYGQCNADNVGCMWYANTREATTTEEAVWVGTTSVGPRIYFDKTLESCPANDDGCTSAYRMITGLPALNLLLNPSFEDATTDTRRLLTVWTPDTTQTSSVVTSGTAALYGNIGHEFVTGSPPITQTVSIVNRRTYTLSVAVRLAGNDGTGSLQALVTQRNAAGTVIVPAVQDFRSLTCLLRSDREPALEATSTLSSGWQVCQCSFLSASDAVAATVTLSGAGVRADGVQLEEREYATRFVNGINTNLWVHLNYPG